jgi:CRP-like cAMP-binding protein
MAKTVFKATKSKAEASFLGEATEGTFIFKEGDLGTDMFIIQTGKVEILKRQNDGEERQLAVLLPGDFFGEMSILEDLPRTASVRALAECKLVRINGTTFDQMLRKNPEIAVRMMRKLSRRLRETDTMLRDVLGSEESQAPEMPTPDAPPEGAMGPECMVHTLTGLELKLSGGEETPVGRRDPVTGINPAIDLTPIDSQRSISRRHATVFRKSGKFYVREEIGTMNGTFVNEERIQTGVPVEFKDGDEVRFGLIKTVFRAS